MSSRVVVTTLLLGGAWFGGCGDDGSGTIIGTDAAPSDVVVDVAVDTPAKDIADVDVAADAQPDVALDGGDGSVADGSVDVDDASSDVGEGGASDGATTDGAITDGGASDAGDGGVLRGHPATAFVAAGSVMTSPSYRMVSTLGQSTIHQTVMRSTGYRLHGGLVGATAGSR